MNEELLDIYDSDMNLLGISSKQQAHQEGLWHKAGHCWIITEDGNIWLQLRGKDKQLYPNLLDVSCAGHIQIDETPKSGTLREIEEELGVRLKENNLEKMFTHKLVFDTPYYNREFCHTYLHKTQLKLTDLKLCPVEVDGMFEADIQDLLDLFLGEIKSINATGLIRTAKGLKIQSKKLTIKDFCPHGDKYYQKVFTTIQRFIDNQ
jgi:isopentenyldiphosphate isomerase